MSEPVLVDTDVISFIFKEHSLAQDYAQLLRGRVALCSFMTLAELHQWSIGSNWGAKKIQRLHEELESYTVLLPDEGICRLWAEVSLEGRRKGRPISVQDAWNAATALHFEVAIVTHNASDYDMIEGLTVLTA